MSETRNDWRALCYALYLRLQNDPPLGTDEILYRVAQRYPHTADRLRKKQAEHLRDRVREQR
jgi:hypothetical protein